MKKNLLKKVSIFSLALIASCLPTISNAETVCTTHKNYYLYLLIDQVPGFANVVYQSNSNHEKEYYNSAYFPTLPENAIAAVNNNSGAISGRICLSKDGVADGTSLQCVKGMTWTLEEYYRIKTEVRSYHSTKEEVFINDERSTMNVYEKETDMEDGNKVIEHYYGGAKWYKCSDAACQNAVKGGSGADTSSLTIEQLVKGSYLPSLTQINFSPAVSSRAIITRKINVKNFLDYLTYDDEGEPVIDDDGNLIINENSQKVVPFQIAWKTGQTPRKSLLAPAVYYVEYQTCGEEYKATINYYYYKNGTTTEKVEFDSDEDNPYKKTDLDESADYSVNSPTKKGCTIVDTNGKKYDADKVVNVLITRNGKASDFEKNVYYYCPAEEEVIQNNKTGDALIYFAWIMGLVAIGYSVYYFRKLKKEEI